MDYRAEKIIAIYNDGKQFEQACKIGMINFYKDPAQKINLR